MTDTAENPPQAWRRPGAIALFVLVTLGVVGADLWLKHWAFEHVAGEPLRLRSDGNGEPVVMLRSGDGEWFDAPRRDPSEPSSAIPIHPSRPLIPGVLDLHLMLNTGAVFGLGKGGRSVFIVVSVLAVGVIGWLFARSPAGARALHVAYALILAGALGNLHDRYHYSAVRDMLHLFPTTPLWPWIFNVADAALMVGVAMVMLLAMRYGRRPPAGETARD